MRKRWTGICSLLLAMVLLFVSCGSASDGGSISEGNGNVSGGASEEADIAEEDMYTVTLVMVNWGEDPVDLDMVEEAASQLVMEKVGCKLELRTVALSELNNKINLWASSGEKADLVMLFGQDLQTLIDQGTILPLTDYVNEEITPNIYAAAQEIPFLADGMVDDEIWRISIINPLMGEGRSLVIRQDILDSLDGDYSKYIGFDFDNMDYLGYEEMDQLFAEIHEKYPDMVTYAQINSLTSSIATYFMNYDAFAGGGAYGVLMNGGRGTTEIVNLFETEEYREYLDWMRKWNEAGYFSGDAATTTDSNLDWLEIGRAATYTNTPDVEGNIEAVTGVEVAMLQMQDPFLTSGAFSAVGWSVLNNCERPDKAMQVLDLLYGSDGELLNLIMNGIEGVHYVPVEGTKMIIDYPEGVDGTTTTYSNSAGFYGYKKYLKLFTPNTDEFFTNTELFSARAVENQSDMIGYLFDTTSVQNELAAINNVMAEYLTMLEYGMSDVDVVLPQFIEALKSAGIDKVIEENQRQLDAWLAEQE